MQLHVYHGRKGCLHDFMDFSWLITCIHVQILECMQTFMHQWMDICTGGIIFFGNVHVYKLVIVHACRTKAKIKAEAHNRRDYRTCLRSELSVRK